MRNTAYAIALLLLLDPFDVARYSGHTTITTFKAALLGVAVALAARRAFFAPRSTQVRWIIAIAVVVFVATCATIPEATYRAPAIREALKALEYVAIFYIGAALARAGRASTKIVSFAAIAVIAIVAIASMFDLVHPQSGMFFNGHAYTRIAGPLEGPNQLAAWLGIMIPIGIISVDAVIFTTIICAIGGMLLANTFSRGGIVQTMCALAALAVTERATRRAITIVVIAGTIGLAGTALAWHSGSLLSHVVSSESSFDPGGTGSREILWRAALAMLKAHPVLGVGAGNFELQLPHYGAAPGIRTQANSLYLEALADGGVVLGIPTIIAAWAAPILLLLRPRTSLSLAAGIAGLALALHGCIDDVTFYTKVGQCWWLIAGVAAAAYEPLRPDGARQPS